MGFTYSLVSLLLVCGFCGFHVPPYLSGFWHSFDVWFLREPLQLREVIGLREVISTFSSLFLDWLTLVREFCCFSVPPCLSGLLTLIVTVISLSAITIERALVCGRLYQLFRPYFLDWLPLVCDFCCFSVPQSLRGFWHWLFLWFLWVPLQLRGHWFGGRVYTLFPPSFLPLRKKKETLSATLFLLFWTALDLVCFLHFESLILRLFFYFFLLDTSLSSALTAVVSINLFICYDALLIYFLFLVQRSTPICLLSVEACDAGFLLPSSG